MRVLTGLLSIAAVLGGTGAIGRETASSAAPRLQIVADVDRGPHPRPPAESARSVYLLSYFKEHVHALHFAVSRDGYNFTDINNGKPVLPSTGIAE